jgi:hypothetical protein
VNIRPALCVRRRCFRPVFATDIFLRVSTLTIRPRCARLQADRCSSLSWRPVNALLMFWRRSSVCFRLSSKNSMSRSKTSENSAFSQYPRFGVPKPSSPRKLPHLAGQEPSRHRRRSGRRAHLMIPRPTGISIRGGGVSVRKENVEAERGAGGICGRDLPVCTSGVILSAAVGILPSPHRAVRVDRGSRPN